MVQVEQGGLGGGGRAGRAGRAVDVYKITSEGLRVSVAGMLKKEKIISFLI